MGGAFIMVRLKIFLVVALSAILPFQPKVQASELPRLVFDNADILTSDEEIALNESAYEFSQNLNSYLVILTATGNTAEGLRDFSDEFYRENFEDESVAMITIDMTARQVALDYYGELGETVSTGDADIIRNRLTPYLSSGDYAAAADIFLSDSAELIEIRRKNPIYNQNGGPSGESNGEPAAPYYQREHPGLGEVALYSALIGGGVSAAAVLFMIVAHNFGLKRKTPAGNYLADNSFYLNYSRDIFLHSHTSAMRIRHDDNSPSGGGGNSSSSSGGGGSSHSQGGF
jgi:uncharacterized protein